MRSVFLAVQKKPKKLDHFWARFWPDFGKKCAGPDFLEKSGFFFFLEIREKSGFFPLFPLFRENLDFRPIWEEILKFFRPSRCAGYGMSKKNSIFTDKLCTKEDDEMYITNNMNDSLSIF